MQTEFIRITTFVFGQLLHVWPLLLGTLPLAVVIKQLNLSAKLNKLLTKNIYISILIATLIGALSPFCSCSVIPIISALLISGIPLAPIMSFWIASPSMDPEIFFLSVASVGTNLAIARIIATLMMSLGAGFITQSLIARKLINANDLLKTNFKSTISECNSCSPPQAITCCTTLGQDFKIIDNTITLEPKKTLRVDFKKLGRDSIEAIIMVTKFLIIAYILEAIIKFYLPSWFITLLVGGSPFVSILKSTLISIPLYTTNLSALGIIAGLIDQGMPQAAALSFLIGGATTTIPAMSAVYGLVKRPIFFLYIGYAILGALLSGFIYALLF